MFETRSKDKHEIGPPPQNGLMNQGNFIAMYEAKIIVQHTNKPTGLPHRCVLRHIKPPFLSFGQSCLVGAVAWRPQATTTRMMNPTRVAWPTSHTERTLSSEWQWRKVSFFYFYFFYCVCNYRVLVLFFLRVFKKKVGTRKAAPRASTSSSSLQSPSTKGWCMKWTCRQSPICFDKM